MLKITLKLILRNWWRNKTFTIIAILSLTVGITFTNLLGAYVIYEKGIEKSNPNIDKMVWVMQDIPSVPGEKVAYASREFSDQMKDKFPEVTDYLQLNSFDVNYIEVNNQRFEPITILNVDPSFPEFFPFELLYGSWDTFNKPNSIIISEKQANRLFGNENALGKQISLSVVGFNSEVLKVYTVGAVAGNRNQSAVSFDGLICNPKDNWGGPTLLMMTENINLIQFEEKVNNSQIPTAMGGQYYFTTVDDSFSITYSQQSIDYWHQRNDNLLWVGLISAILVLLIAIFNYINMSFSRLLQQISNVQVQKLMGAGNSDIRLQFFGDTFLMVLISLIFSSLLIFDLLPVVNHIVSLEFTPSFFFSSSYFLFFLLFILLMTVVPALFISRKVSKLSNENYRMFFVTKKNQLIGVLVTFQFIITIALIIAMITVNRQVNLVKSTGEKYYNVIEIGRPGSDLNLGSFKKRIETLPGVYSISIGELPILNSGIMFSSLKNEKGEEIPTAILQISADSELLNVYNIKQLKGESWEYMHEKHQNGILVNETFVNITGSVIDHILGEPLDKYLESDDSLLIIAGVIEDFQYNSMEEKVIPVIITPLLFSQDKISFLQIRLSDENKSETLNVIKFVWEQTFPEENFIYSSPYDTYMQRNKKTFDMFQLLSMYSIISILLVCFGLFGISYYAVRLRTKEIGIRKINGAKTDQILWLLLKPMFLWITVGFAIGAPLAWIFIDRWLQQFAYRVNITLESCLLGFILVVIVSTITVTWHTIRTAKENPVVSLKSD